MPQHATVFDDAPAPVRVPTEVTPRAGISALLVRDAAGLAEHVPAWESLAAEAIEPNVFYEPWMLLPALEAFGKDQDLYFVLVYGTASEPGQAAPLYGFFPLQRQRRYKGIPASTFRLWQHKHCFLCTPLLRAGYAREGLAGFWNWLASSSHRAALMEFCTITGDGPFDQLLTDHLREQGCRHFLESCSTRAFFRPRADGQAYLAEALSGEHRRENRRHERRLADQGRLEYHDLARVANIEASLEEFLRLEASGWKGKVGGAMACDPASRQFFLQVGGEAFRRGILEMLALQLEGRSIALRCDFVSGHGAFSFKVAYDEQFARFSPGLLLELETIRRLHSQSEIHWMDSCTSSHNEKLNRVWLDRRTIKTILAATGKASGGFWVSVMPFLRRVNRLGRRLVSRFRRGSSAKTD
jgi:CelD/BcsL family acetyltransferase involved in cellulose biosynthesis